MKIGIGDPDIPGDEAMRADVDLFLGHDERAVEQIEIADGAAAFFANRERAAGITGNMFADNNCVRLRADEFAKDLRALAVKTFAEFHVWRDRMRSPTLIRMS